MIDESTIRIEEATPKNNGYYECKGSLLGKIFYSRGFLTVRCELQIMHYLAIIIKLIHFNDFILFFHPLNVICIEAIFFYLFLCIKHLPSFTKPSLKYCLSLNITLLEVFIEINNNSKSSVSWGGLELCELEAN